MKQKCSYSQKSDKAGFLISLVIAGTLLYFGGKHIGIIKNNNSLKELEGKVNSKEVKIETNNIKYDNKKNHFTYEGVYSGKLNKNYRKR